MSGERLGVGRVCPQCGARSDTLGRICPACRKPYAGRGLLERSPLLLVLGFALVAVTVWLLFTNLAAGIVMAAATFGLLVAAIAASNALAERGR